MRVQVTGGRQPRDHYYCYNARNQLEFVRSGPDCNGSPAVMALGYDAQGNLAFKNGSTYGFDYGNRLRSAAGQGYRYDAQGRRVRSDVGGAQRRYSFYAQDGRLLWQRDEVAGTRSVNVYLAGSLVAEYRRPLSGANASVGFLHTDPLGSPIAKTDATGAVVETSEYEPYGLLLNRANDDRPGYTGHVMDSATGLTYMQQRYYDPGIGRFLSVDPVTADFVSGGNFNRYWYGADNPYRFTDPDGRLDWDKIANSFKVEVGFVFGLGVKAKLGPLQGQISSPEASYGWGATLNDVYTHTEINGFTFKGSIGDFELGRRGSQDRSEFGRRGEAESRTKSEGAWVAGYKNNLEGSMNDEKGSSAELAGTVSAVFVRGSASVDVFQLIDGIFNDPPSGKAESKEK
jgi:RHS repeat-associated protein